MDVSVSRTYKHSFCTSSESWTATSAPVAITSLRSTVHPDSAVPLHTPNPFALPRLSEPRWYFGACEGMQGWNRHQPLSSSLSSIKTGDTELCKSGKRGHTRVSLLTAHLQSLWGSLYCHLNSEPFPQAWLATTHVANAQTKVVQEQTAPTSSDEGTLQCTL